MDVGAYASAMIGAWVGRLQVAAAATMLHMGADGANSAVELVDSAQQNFDRLANVAAGIGRNLDISV